MVRQLAPRARKVRILATLGPASNTPEMIERLSRAGADAFRVNMSHGTHADHRRRIERIRQASDELCKPVAILADLQGPKLRTGIMQEGGVPLKKGA